MMGIGSVILRFMHYTYAQFRLLTCSMVYHDFQSTLKGNCDYGGNQCLSSIINGIAVNLFNIQLINLINYIWN